MSKISINSIKFFLSLLIIILFSITGCAHSSKSAPSLITEAQADRSQDILVQNDQTLQGDAFIEEDVTDDELFLLEDEEETATTTKEMTGFIFSWPGR